MTDEETTRGGDAPQEEDATRWGTIVEDPSRGDVLIGWRAANRRVCLMNAIDADSPTAGVISARGPDIGLLVRALVAASFPADIAVSEYGAGPLNVVSNPDTSVVTIGLRGNPKGRGPEVSFEWQELPAVIYCILATRLAETPVSPFALYDPSENDE